MGFATTSYEILASPSPRGPKHRESSKPAIVLDFIKKWLFCGWAASKDSSSSNPPSSPSTCRPDGYVPPPGWKRMLRRAKAKTHRVQSKCCESLCFAPPQEPLNYQSIDSYKKNFDEGPESWWGQHQSSQWSSTSASVYDSAAPIWQRRSMVLPELKVSTPILVAAA